MTDQPASIDRTGRQIGPIGSIARLCIGLAILIAGLLADPSSFDLVAGLVILPVAELVVVWLLPRPGSTPLRLYGTQGYALNFGIGGPLLVLWTTPALLFYGASILLAFVRGYAGCEILALSNLLRRRDDQLACAVFSPIDALEAAH